jgi:hypothetical protein
MVFIPATNVTIGQWFAPRVVNLTRADIDCSIAHP